MKLIKRAAAAALAVIMVLAMCVSTTFADTVSITVTGGQEGQLYEAYLIFHLEITTTNSGEGYVYYLDENLYDDQGNVTGTNPFYTLIQSYIASKTVSGEDYSGISLYATTRTDINGNTVDTYEVQVDTTNADTSKQFDAEALAAYIKAAIDADSATYASLMVDSATATAGSGNIVTATLSADEYGYYFINTNLGSLAILDSTTSTAKITEKNDAPSADKEVTEIEGEAVTSDSDKTVEIGDEVEYQITITGGEGFVDYDIVATDILSKGLTAPSASDVVVYDSEGNTWALDTDYTVEFESETTTDGQGNTSATGRTIMTITLKSADNGGNYLSTLTDTADVIYITYTATVNSDAAEYSNSTTGITNEVTLTYGRDGSYETKTVTEEVDTFRFGIYKYAGTSGLAGAKFTVYDSTGTALGFVKTTGAEPDNFVYYRLATDEELQDPDAYGVVYEIETEGKPDTVLFEGLDAGTYTVKEVEAPAGYNILNGEITVVIDSDGNRTYTYTGTDGMVTTTSGAYVSVKNESGSTLPSAGGMGTRIFYTVGGILVVGAGILLITKRRMKADK